MEQAIKQMQFPAVDTPEVTAPGWGCVSRVFKSEGAHARLGLCRQCKHLAPPPQLAAQLGSWPDSTHFSETPGIEAGLLDHVHRIGWRVCCVCMHMRVLEEYSVKPFVYKIAALLPRFDLSGTKPLL